MAAEVDTPTAIMSGTDMPPPYYALKEDASTEEKATEVLIPDSHDNAPETYGHTFEDKDIRIGFIQKVLAIKTLQVLAVTLVMLIFAVCPFPLYRALVQQPCTRAHLTVVSLLILVATAGLLHYCDRARFAVPYNYMFLVAYPLSVSFFVSVATYNWGFNEVFVSWVQFNIVTLALLLYSILTLQTKMEFKTNIALLITGVIFLVFYPIIVPLMDSHDSAFGVLYCSLMMIALTAYILNDIQAMMSRTYRVQLSPSDFVKAALIMHIDYRYMIMKYKKHFLGRNFVNSAENAA